MSDSDVLVIGAGVIGAAVAFELAAAGRRVRVIEARAPGRGATQASAGMLAPYTEGHGSPWLATLGRRSLDLYDGFVERVVQASGCAVTYGRPGTLEVAADAAQAASLRGAASRLAAEGVAAEWLDARELAALEPALAPAAGALFIRTHGFVAAAGLTAAMVAAATRLGAIVDAGTRVEAIEPDADGLAVRTNAGRWHAPRVVLAAGSWSGDLVAGETRVPVHPVRGQLLVLHQDAPRLQRVAWGPDCYVVPWPDGTVLVGATMEDAGFDERASLAGVSALASAARALVPSLDAAAFVGVRVGLRPAGPGPLPLVGPSSQVPGLIHASCHFRNGVLLAPLTAALVRAVVDGAADPALELLQPSAAGL